MLVVVILFLTSCTSSNVKKVDGFSIKVLDKASGKPLVGVLVVASFVARSGTHGSTVGLSNALEVLSDVNGVATFPNWSTEGPGFGGSDPILVAYKTGYMSARSYTRSTRKRVKGIFHVSNIKLSTFPDGLMLTECKDTSSLTSEECENEAFSKILHGIGPIFKQPDLLPILKKIAEGHYKI
jgi:hypothetical protein